MKMKTKIKTKNRKQKNKKNYFQLNYKKVSAFFLPAMPSYDKALQKGKKMKEKFLQIVPKNYNELCELLMKKTILDGIV